MTKREFIDLLVQALEGEVPQSVIRENVNYYNTYIAEQERQGISEKEVLEGIGDPRLIAKTIIDACPVDGDGGYTYERGSTYTDSGYDEPGQAYGQREESPKVHYFDMSKWYWRLLVTLIPILLVVVVISLVIGSFTLLIRFGPILLIIYLIYVLIRSMKH